MPKPRTVRTPRQTEDDFIAAYEKPNTTELPLDERVAARAEGRYFQLLSYRGTEDQKKLIDYAAAKEGKSKQKLLEGIIMRRLEELLGSEVDMT